MTGDPFTLLACGSAATIGFALAAGAALQAWRQWLVLKRLELSAAPGGGQIAELRARVRRLESIAGGIEI
jgi:hypothetical protein